MLADEVLTPDSSRFWPADEWQPGRAQPSYDKQIVRNWLLSPGVGWDRASGEPPPPLPDEVVERTRARYVEAYELLTGADVLTCAGRGRRVRRAAPEVAFDYLVDPRHRPEWQSVAAPRSTDVDRRSPGSARPGSTSP